MPDHTITLSQRIFRSSFPEAEATGFRTSAWAHGVAGRAEELRPYHPTLLHAFATAAKHEARSGITLITPGERGAADTEEQRSYRALYHQSTKLAGALLAAGVQKGDRVLLVMPTGFELILGFFAIELAGAVPVPTYPPSGLRIEMAVERLCHVATQSGARYCLTDKLVHKFLGELALRVPALEAILDVEDLQAGNAKAPDKLRAGGDDPGFIQYTSGSTGFPKGVLLTHDNLTANIHAIGQALRIRRTDVTISWLPLYHDMGLIGTLLFSIYWRLPLVLMDPTAFLLKPSRWLWAIHKYKGTLSPAPNFAYALCVRRVKPAEREGLDLSTWRLAMNGAEPVNFRTLTSFNEVYEPHGFKYEAMLPVYGLAEASLAVTFPAVGEVPRCEVVDRAALANGHAVEAEGKGSFAVVSVGKPVPGHDVVVVDQGGEMLPDREVGHILVRGPSVMQGYYGDPEATKAVLRDGWLWTGDLGYYADGELFITGRAKDLIILRGRNIYAEDLERVAERVEGVRPGGAYAFGVYDEDKATDLVVVVVETRLTKKQEQHATLVEKVGEMVMEFCEVKIDEVVVVGPGTVPKTSSGKKQRALCRQLYLDHQLKGPPSKNVALGLFFVRSRAGFLLAGAKRLLGRRRRAPD